MCCHKLIPSTSKNIPERAQPSKYIATHKLSKSHNALESKRKEGEGPAERVVYTAMLGGWGFVPQPSSSAGLQAYKDLARIHCQLVWAPCFRAVWFLLLSAPRGTRSSVSPAESKFVCSALVLFLFLGLRGRCVEGFAQ
jgi:hypothetical protein